MRYLKKYNVSDDESGVVGSEFKFDKVITYTENDGVEINDEGNPPPDEFWYVSTDGNVVEFERAGGSYQGYSVPEIVSNTYVDGKGIVKCASAIEAFYYWTSNWSDASKIKLFKFSNEVKTFQFEIFDGYTNLEELEFPDNMMTYPSMILFSLYNLKRLKLPKHLKRIEGVDSFGFTMFNNCIPEEGIILPDNLKTISSSVRIMTFDYNVKDIYNQNPDKWENIKLYIGENLSNVIFSATFLITDYYDDINVGYGEIVVSKYNDVFDSRDNCNAVIETATNKLLLGCKNTAIPNTVTSIGGSAFFNCVGLTSLTIPNSVTTIEGYAFSGCRGLTSVTIGNSVTSIGNQAFAYCYGLTSVTIGNSVTSIGQDTFQNCTGLTSVVVSDGNTVYDSRNNCNAIIKTSTNELILGCKNTIIPNSVTSIGKYTFQNCTGLTSVTIPSSVTSIGEGAFIGCSGLTSITIPNSVTTIGGSAFYLCSGLTSVTCESTTPPTLGIYTFDITNNCPIYVPSASVNTYKSASGWSSYASRIQAIPS